MTRLAASMLRNRSGAAAAEMALMLPLLMVLLFTMFEGGNYLWNEHKVVTGVRDAARYAGRLPLSTFMTNTSGTYACNGSVADPALTQIKTLARTGIVGGTAARVSGWTDTVTTVSLSCTTAGGMYAVTDGQAARVTVSATVPYASLFTGAGYWTITLPPLTASAQSPVIGL